jgi:hypothetical protein
MNAPSVDTSGGRFGLAVLCAALLPAASAAQPP